MKKLFNCKHLSLELSGNKQVVGGLVLLNALVAVFAPVLLLVTLTASFLYFFRVLDHKNVAAKDLYSLSTVGKFLVLVLIQIILVVVVLGFVHQSAKISLLIAVLAAFLFSYVSVLVQTVFSAVVSNRNTANDEAGLLTGPKTFLANTNKEVAGVKVSDVYSTVVVFLAVLALSTSAHGVSFVGFLALLVLLTELFNVTAVAYNVLTSKEVAEATEVAEAPEAAPAEDADAPVTEAAKAKCGSCKLKCAGELVRKVFALFFNSIAGIFQFGYGLADDLKEVRAYYKEERAAEKARLEAEFDKVVEAAEQEGQAVAEKAEAVEAEVKEEVEAEVKEAPAVKFNGLSVDDTAAKGFVASETTAAPETADEDKEKDNK